MAGSRSTRKNITGSNVRLRGENGRRMEGTTFSTKIFVSVLILVALFLIATFIAGFILFFQGGSENGNVAVIPIEGVIVSSSGGFDGTVSSDMIVDDIRRAEDDDKIKAVLFRINSPGGSAVASDEVAEAIKRLKKPSIAVISEVGASGAYWITSACNHSVANRMSITGSIGVIGSYLSFGRFLNDWNVTYNRLIAGSEKDLGTPFREPTPKEKAFLQKKLDMIHEYFIEAVAENRNLSLEKVRSLADGSFFLGAEAKEDGLIDQLGNEQDALDWINATIGEKPVTVLYKHKRSLTDLLSSLETQKSSLPGALESVGLPRTEASTNLQSVMVK